MKMSSLSESRERAVIRQHSRFLPRLGDRPITDIDAQTVADLVANLHEHGLKKQTIRKTVSVLAMVLDHAGVQPNPARDRLTVKLPREERRQVQPPTRSTSRRSFASCRSGIACPR
jgi:site-specific recombinase XerC